MYMDTDIDIFQNEARRVFIFLEHILSMHPDIPLFQIAFCLGIALGKNWERNISFIRGENLFMKINHITYTSTSKNRILKETGILN